MPQVAAEVVVLVVMVVVVDAGPRRDRPQITEKHGVDSTLNLRSCRTWKSPVVVGLSSTILTYGNAHSAVACCFCA